MCLDIKSIKLISFRVVVLTAMANDAAPERGSAAAAGMRRRRTTRGGSAGVASNMLQFYSEDAPGVKISPQMVLVMSIGFIAFVAFLHVIGKLYLVPREMGTS
ncbi:hypothetical protein IFM89_027930 [Coptis chinensis]|uniref:Protein transport protein Sec61 subunit beta n=1 Tax=Coptis chinensis TaxID=261450 RepID=A0A835IDT9_9MAGN|nr:hypothetical protein IFM89_027930 [Coptis chinensis]